MSRDFELSAYDYDLPPELIAQNPAPERTDARLMVIKENKVQHSKIKQILDHLPPHTTLVFNQSKVFPCRLLAHKKSGGEAELFFLSLVPRGENYQVMIKASGKRKVGDLFVTETLTFVLEEINSDGTFGISTTALGSQVQSLLESHAKIPLPPYIRGGEEEENDRERYQTVYAKLSGSVAAPTAGLHFSKELLKQIEEAGHEVAFVTLHVGLGTFKPVKTKDIRDHQMHAETYMVDDENIKKIKNSKGPVVAVGTTTLRVLETSYREGFKAGEWRTTNIFLYPGERVHSIQGLLTNFHLPGSSLLMLVSALLGRNKTLELYHLAVKEKYRFFSYGDAMLIWL
jgi:S-adenosylmethionine:tRNA ribosyltransferase-isomerase